MKKILLSIFAVMLAVFSVQAEEVTKSVIFSDYDAGTQYAKDEEHDLGEGLVIYTTECHFTSELRIYSSSTHNGYVVSDALPGTITKMRINPSNSNKLCKEFCAVANIGLTYNLTNCFQNTVCCERLNNKVSCTILDRFDNHGLLTHSGTHNNTGRRILCTDFL